MHAPGHLRGEVLELIEDDEILTNKEKTKRLLHLLRKLYRCTDIMPSDAIDTLNNLYGLLPSDEELPKGSTYAMCARRLTPLLKQIIEEL